MSRHEQVERAFGRVGVTHQAPFGPNRVQTTRAAGDQLVRINLVARVPDQAIAGEIKAEVKRQAKLDDAKIAGEMCRPTTDDVDKLGPHLGGELLELGFG